MSKGILLMVHSSPFYGKWAFNMAYSIRSFTDLPIHLVYDQRAVAGIDLSIFDSSKEYEFSNDYCFEKLDLYDKSPFDQTLYLDVDGICLKNPEPIFEELKDCKVWMQPMGKGYRHENITYTWASNEIVFEKYNLKGIFQTTQTSIIYFTKEAKRFFDKAKENYSNRLEEKDYREMWGKRKQHPDELYYSIALSQLKIELKDLKPVFFPEKIEKISSILENYYILSMYGGNNVKPYAKDLYDRIMFNVMKDFNMDHIYKVYNLYKNKFISR